MPALSSLKLLELTPVVASSSFCNKPCLCAACPLRAKVLGSVTKLQYHARQKESEVAHAKLCNVHVCVYMTSCSIMHIMSLWGDTVWITPQIISGLT